MIRFLRIVVVAVVAIVLLSFAVANRQIGDGVVRSFRIGQTTPHFAIPAPLFAVVIASAMLGVIAGSAATWVSQGRHRRAARRHRADAEKWRAQAGAPKAEPPRSPSLLRPSRCGSSPPMRSTRPSISQPDRDP